MKKLSIIVSIVAVVLILGSTGVYAACTSCSQSDSCPNCGSSDCPGCDTSSGSTITPCSSCQGTGEVSNALDNAEVTCPNCSGTGTTPCTSCNSAKKHTSSSVGTLGSRLGDIIRQNLGDHTAMRNQIRQYLSERRLNRTYRLSNR